MWIIVRKYKIFLSVAIIFNVFIVFKHIIHANNEFREGKHFKKLTVPILEDVNSEKIVSVRQVFSFGCTGCHQIEQDLEEWVNKKDGEVKLLRLPLISSKESRDGAIGYIVAEELGVSEKYTKHVFNNLKAANKIIFPSKREMIELFHSMGFKRSIPKKIWSNNEKIKRKIAQNEKIITDNQLFTMPAFIVDGKYWVSAETADLSKEKLFEILEYLVQKSVNKTTS